MGRVFDPQLSWSNLQFIVLRGFIRRALIVRAIAILPYFSYVAGNRPRAAHARGSQYAVLTLKRVPRYRKVSRAKAQAFRYKGRAWPCALRVQFFCQVPRGNMGIFGQGQSKTNGSTELIERQFKMVLKRLREQQLSVHISL